METEGLFAPETAAEARGRYDSVEPTAETTVKQAAKAIQLGARGYDERVTGAVVETAREGVVAALLTVQVGDREVLKQRRAEHRDRMVVELGGEHTDRVVRHAAPVTETVVVTGFHEQRRAAVETLRRQVFDRIYGEVVRCAG